MISLKKYGRYLWSIKIILLGLALMYAALFFPLCGDMSSVDILVSIVGSLFNNQFSPPGFPHSLLFFIVIQPLVYIGTVIIILVPGWNKFMTAAIIAQSITAFSLFLLMYGLTFLSALFFYLIGYLFNPDIGPFSDFFNEFFGPPGYGLYLMLPGILIQFAGRYSRKKSSGK